MQVFDLEEKKQFYTDKMNEIQNEDYSDEIELKLSEYKLKLISEYESKKDKDLEKIHTYIELLDELITEAKTKEELEEKEEYIEKGEN